MEETLRQAMDQICGEEGPLRSDGHPRTWPEDFLKGSQVPIALYMIIGF